MVPSDYRVIGVGCDVSSELSVQQAFRRVMDQYGRIDSVVASAGEWGSRARVCNASAASFFLRLIMVFFLHL